MVDTNKMRENLKEKYGEKLDEVIQKKVKETGKNETIALFQLHDELDVETPIETKMNVGEFKKHTIKEIREKVEDIVREISDAVEENKITDTVNNRSLLVNPVVLYAGVLGKQKSYKSGDRTDYKQRVGFVDPTGFIEGTILKKETIDKLLPQMTPGKIFGMNIVFTNYYHPHRKVSLSLNKKTEFVDVDEKLTEDWIQHPDEVNEYDGGIIKSDYISKPSVTKYIGCSNPRCPDFPKKQDAETCRTCGEKTKELVSRTYPVMIGSKHIEMRVMPWKGIEIDRSKPEQLFAVRKFVTDGQESYSLLCIVDEKPEKIDKPKEQPKTKPKDVKLSEVDKKRIKEMAGSIQKITRQKLPSLSKAIGINADSLEVGLDMLANEGFLKKEGLEWISS